MPPRSAYEVDGGRFGTLQEFYAEISRVLIPGAEWGHTLDAFNDILRGGFGTPDGGFVLRWVNSERSRERLRRAARGVRSAGRRLSAAVGELRAFGRAPRAR